MQRKLLLSKKSIFCGIVWLLPILFLFDQSVTQAQSVDPPFSTAIIRLSYSENTNRNVFHKYWSPVGGGQFDLSFPFYFGNIQGGLHIFNFSGRDEDFPDFNSRFIFIGWGLNYSIMKNLDWFTGIRTGNYQMDFDDPQINETQRLESELALELFSRLDFSVDSSWSVQVTAGYLHVYTHKKIGLVLLSAGVGYSFQTPSWVKEFFE